MISNDTTIHAKQDDRIKVYVKVFEVSSRVQDSNKYVINAHTIDMQCSTVNAMKSGLIRNKFFGGVTSDGHVAQSHCYFAR
jgi:hypothetical protein